MPILRYQDFARYLHSFVFLALLGLGAGCNTDVGLGTQYASLNVTPEELFFEPTRVGETGRLTVTFSEASGANITEISVLTLSGEGRTDFQLASTEAFTLQRSEQRSLDIFFAPQSPGETEATFSFSATNLNSEDLPVVRLIGEALGPDQDGDGLSEEEGDCDDFNPHTNPDAPEKCNGADDDCDGTIDEDATDTTTFYEDGDSDGYGLEGYTTQACASPEGFSLVSGDCDDGDASIYPGASETCDGIDEDCDALIDEDATDTTPYYPDVDQDGLGSDEGALPSCTIPPGYVPWPGDCDDNDAAIFPGAGEMCDGVDQDCDGLIDEAALDATPYWPDGDGDGFGAGLSPTMACAQPNWTAPRPGDCNDVDAAIYPGADETCDGVDEDCDGDIDEEAVDADPYFTDSDGDSYGDPDGQFVACVQPPGGVLNNGDCDDTDPGVNPGAGEVCNGRDDDCNGLIDDNPVGIGTWYVDGDGDTYGGLDTVESCEPVAGHVLRPGDCDDDVGTIHPNADETCNGIDDDCDVSIDEDAVDPVTFYQDGDSDGFGETSTQDQACEPEGVLIAGDCDDENPSVYPEAPERCGGIDEDCDGVVDEEAVDAPTFYVDGDGDTYGDDEVVTCVQPARTSTRDGDCDDGDPAVFPAAVEVCNGKDDDCDGVVDLDAVNPGTYYYDADSDGFGGPTQVDTCEAPMGFISQGGDCVDDDAGIYPGQVESCDGKDEDCDGLVDEEPRDPILSYDDGDGDGFGDGDSPIEACTQVGVLNDGDCDDLDASIFPGATETCDGEDEDCDGQVDEDAADPGAFYPDGDDDGFGSMVTPTYTCTPEAGYVSKTGDCNDEDQHIYPGADEICDGVDQDCDALIDETPIDGVSIFPDGDGDGFGQGSGTTACAPPGGFSEVDGDCDDAADHIYPGADEYCDDADGDCDGTIDEDAVDATTWGQDGDGDGYGTGPLVTQCDPPGGGVPVDDEHPEDCDDADYEVNPDATDICNGEDRNCDGLWSRADCDGCHVDQVGDGALYRTIQRAVDDAVIGLDFGGEIRVCGGTYVESLRLRGAPVMIRGVGSVIIRPPTCTSTVDRCSSVAFRDGEDERSGLINITLSAGRGTLEGDVLGGASSQRLGGGALIYGATPVFEDVTITSAVADEGAGIYLKDGSVSLTRVTLEGCEGVQGAGIFAEGSALILEDVAILDGHSNFQGGGIYLDDSTLDMLNVRLEENVANGFGGGIFAQDSDVTLEEVSFTDNYSTSQAGGGLYHIGGSLIMEGGVFQENVVDGGGTDVGGGGAYLKNLDIASFDETRFIANDSGSSGGGISAIGVDVLELVDTEARYNVADDSGGGLYVKTVSTLEILRPLFYGNEGRYGAGLRVQGSSGMVRHAYFVQNSAREFGGGLHLEGGSVDILNSAFLSNVGRRGGGAYTKSTSGGFLNNTAIDNVATEGQGGAALEVESIGAGQRIRNNIFAFSAGYLVRGQTNLAGVFLYNDLYSLTGKESYGFSPGMNNITTDPLLYDILNGEEPQTWDLGLKPWSGCVDSGDPSEDYYDLDGTPNDMGIYGGPTPYVPAD